MIRAILFISLTLSLAAFAQEKPSKCSYYTEGFNPYQKMSQKVSEQYRQMRKDHGADIRVIDVLKSMPTIMLFRNDSEFTVPDLTESSVLIEGFYRAGLDEEDYVLVPVLGIGIDFKPHDVFYFCIEYSPQERDRRITILPMEPSFMTSGWLGRSIREIFLEKEIIYQKKLVSVNFNPIKGAANFLRKLFDKVPPLKGLYKQVDEKLFQSLGGVIDFAWLIIKRWTVGYGATEVVIRPDRMDVAYELRILNVSMAAFNKNKPRRYSVIKLETPQLKDEFFDTTEREVVMPLPQ